MCSERPEYNEKIKMMHALAPVAYMNNAASPVMRFLGANVITLQVTSLHTLVNHVMEIQRCWCFS